MTPPRARLTPKTFLKGRRPDAYSDSAVAEERPRISRQQLEYHLDQITPSKQESEFEGFCHRLVSIEISPNLIPQTGPVGGGDSKADAATHPVSNDLRHRYWYALASASGEQFAFAFSAKRAWPGKARDDVAGIMTWPNPPAHIYFVTNQAARDKTKKKLENELRKKYGVKVTILDRKWIAAAIIDHRLEDLVEQYLHIPLERSAAVRSGRRDTERSDRLAILRSRLSRPVETYGAPNSYLMIEEYLEAAMMARELELPSVETGGFLASAREAAVERGYAPQTLRVLYQCAWTALYYHDDEVTAWRRYLELEPLAFASGDSDAESCAITVVTTLRGAASVGAVPEELLADLLLAEQRLQTHLEEVARANADRPRGWRAACDLDLFRLSLPGATEEARRAHVKALVAKLDRHGTALELPVRRYLELVTVAMSLAESPSVDDDALFRTVTKIGSARMSEVETGTMFCARGGDALSGGRTRTALRFLAEGRELLLKAETLDRVVHATLLISLAYRKLDLAHASFAEATIGVRHAARPAEQSGRPDHLLALAAASLSCAAVATGDAPQALEALHLFVGVRSALPAEVGERLTERLDGELALELVGLRPDAPLTVLRTSRDLLLAASFPRAALAVAFVAGEHADLTAQGVDIRGAMKQFLESEAVRRQVRAVEGRTWKAATFSTSVLGLPVTATGTTATTQRVALCLLAGIEAFVGVSNRRDACPWPQRVDIMVREDGEKLMVGRKEIGPHSSWVVDCPTNYRGVPGSARQEELFAVVLEIVASSFMFGLSQATRTIEDLLRDEKTLERIAPVLQTIAALRDGAAPLTFDEPRERWWAAAGHTGSRAIGSETYSGHSPYGGENESHGGNQFGLISIPDWDAARWRGVAYAVGGTAPPELGLLFENETAALSIFRGLGAVLGPDDVDARMTIGLIVDDDDPGRYAVVVTSNIPAAPRPPVDGDAELFSIVARVLATTTVDPSQRDGFVHAAHEAQSFVLRAAVIDPAAKVVRPLDVAITLHSVVSKRAGDLSDSEMAMFGIAQTALADAE